MSVNNIDTHSVKLCCEGDWRAWNTFVKTYYEYVFNVARGVFTLKQQKNDTSDVEEVTQMVFEKLVKDDFRILKSWDSSRSKLSTWLTVIARRVAIDWLRSSKRLCETIVINNDAVEVAVDPVSMAESSVLGIDMTQLTDRQQQIMIMLYMEDMDVGEVSAALQITPQTVRSLRHQALATMRRQYGVAV